MPASSDPAERAAAAYYDSDDAELYFATLWGGEDLHIGLYDGAGSVREASDAIVDRMAAMVPHLKAGGAVLDLGAGFGGAMRRIAARHPVTAVCLNLVERQNAYNRRRIVEAGLDGRIAVVGGSFERVPVADAAFDVVWSQDALLHASDFAAVTTEAWRVLRPDGLFVFTDILAREGTPPDALAPIARRLGIGAFRTERGDRAAAEAAGFAPLPFVPLTPHFARHYAQIGLALVDARDELLAKGVSNGYLDRTMAGVRDWIAAAEAGRIVWGIQRYIK